MPESTNITVANQDLAELQQQAVELSAEQEKELMSEAQSELKEMVRCLKKGDTNLGVQQFLAGWHALKFVNICRKFRSRAFATGELKRELGWYMGRSVDPNLIIRTYVAILLLHGDLTPPPAKNKVEVKAWNDRVDNLPPLGHFQKGYAQLVEDQVVGNEERWVLEPGYEQEALDLYASCQLKRLGLEDESDGSKVLEKGVLTLVREHKIDYLRFKSSVKEAEAVALSQTKNEAVERATEFEDKVKTQMEDLAQKIEQAKKAETPEDKAKKEAEAQKARDELFRYQAGLKEQARKADEAEKAAKAAMDQARSAERQAAKDEAKLEKKRSGGEDTDRGNALPWQAQMENAAVNASPKDFAQALYNAVRKNSEPETVLVEMDRLHNKSMDVSNPFTQSMAAFELTWQRKSAAKVS